MPSENVVRIILVTLRCRFAVKCALRAPKRKGLNTEFLNLNP